MLPTVYPFSNALGGTGIAVLVCHVVFDSGNEETPEPAALRIGRAPGRRRTLLLDDDSTLAATVYAIHLAVDENVPAAMALRAARASGLTHACEDFVDAQVERIESQRTLARR